MKSAAKPILTSLVLAGAMIAASLILKRTPIADWLGPDGVDRGSQVIIGLWLAVYANYMPKGLSLGSMKGPNAGRMQSAVRLGGWSFTLAGLAYAAISAFAPTGVGDPLSVAVVVAAMLVTMSYLAWTVITVRRDGGCRPAA